MSLGYRKKVSQQKVLRGEEWPKNIGAMQRQRRQRFRKEGNNEDSEWFLLCARK